jgi:hypothetical protein
VLIRLICLFMVGVFSSMVLLACGDAAMDAGILVFRREVAVRRQQATRPGPDWADRAENLIRGCEQRSCGVGDRP